MERRLAAVMIADVAGYGRLSQVDEEGTRARFQADLHDIFEPRIADYHGRLVKTMGDGLLVEFHSVVQALRCAVEVQRAKLENKAEIPTDRRLEFRIGINLGDVIVEGDDIHGDGVNIADRLQALADKGGVTISSAAYEQVKNKLDVSFEFLGEQRVKNITEPVRVYRVLMAPKAAESTIRKSGAAVRSWRRTAAAAAALVLLIAAGAAALWRPWEPRFEPDLPLPDRPSVAVLPFANMSSDPEQDYFADGIADDLITELSRIPDLFVIARNSSFAYKSKSIDIRQVARELGVRYVLEGSIRRSGDDVRINAQLVDASTGGQHWADRYYGSLADIFALQDKVTDAIVDALALRLIGAEPLAVSQQETKVPAAYDAFLRGWVHYRRSTAEDYAKAIPYFEEAVKLDPDYGRAHAALAMVHIGAFYARWSYGMGIPPEEARRRAKQHLEEARKRPTALAHQAAAYLLMTDWLHEAALAELKEAIALEPGDPWSYSLTAWILTSAGRPAEAIPHIRTAMRLDPHYPSFFGYVLGLTEFSMGHFEEAAIELENITKLNPDFEYSFLLLGATYGHLGRIQDAASAIAHYNEIRVSGGDTPLTVSAAPPLDLSKDVDRTRLLEGLRRAGVPEFLFSGKFATQNRLTADEIRTLVFGRRLHGRSPWTGEERVASIAGDGVVALSGDWGLLGGGPLTGGSVRLDGDQLCYEFDIVSYCGDVLRNPGGTKTKENEFIWYNGEPFTFSPME